VVPDKVVIILTGARRPNRMANESLYQYFPKPTTASFSNQALLESYLFIMGYLFEFFFLH
jgi:hypothetical protein